LNRAIDCAGATIDFLRSALRDADAAKRLCRLPALFGVAVLFGFIILQNAFVRNWTSWFGNKPPKFFAPITFVAEAILLLFVPLTLVYCVMTEGIGPEQAPRSAIRSAI